ncbi:DUF4232 domain-containing protein [Streptomyces sp. NPDC047869]|uniref:DUF4232 domain-containing protein n=1 Tax=Streptomyces sp. NPDC047869 TaxID=3154709 RepID=UPI0034554AB7
MSTRTRRTRLLFASALAATALTLTACNDGQDVRDEGASAGTASTPAPTASATSSAKAGGGTSDGSADGSAGGAAASSGTTGSQASSGSKGSSGSTGSKGSPDSKGSGAISRCSVSATRTTATVVSRPLNHLLLTVTNTGSKNCDLLHYPAVRFGEAQSVPAAYEDSKPQAVVTLAPGESGYAGVRLSAGDGSGSHGYTTKSLEVYFDTSAKVAAHPALPAKGVYVDDSVQVTYWQSTMDDALNW